MKIVFLTPGTGSYYCGACMRDNALARELHRAGDEVTMAPMYLPHTLDEEALPGSARVPVFFGGINVYLQQKVPLFRRTPAFVDRLLNSTGLLRWAARHSHMTSARDHGEMTLEMFNVGSSRLGKELEKLMGWLEHSERPDVVCLSTALLAGFAEPLKRRLGAPVVTFFQGEDTFLDGLPEPYRTQCWEAMAGTLRASDLILSPSRFYADLMGRRLGLARDAVKVVFNGIQLEGYAAAESPPATPTIGYLARMCREKGFEVMVDAFLHLAGELGDRETRLHLAGAATAGDEPLIRRLRARIESAGLAARVTWAPNLSREEKISFLRGLSLFSVPASYAEAFGLYLVEAMACGVPVVQPQSAAFPELIAAGGGGLCVPAREPAALARAWRDLLRDPARRTELGRAGRAAAENHFSSSAWPAAIPRRRSLPAGCR
ncbi:MAG: glycosyltransferase family 4 protein [Opitutaceae bacterium]